jgi:hypothetical protein
MNFSPKINTFLEILTGSIVLNYKRRVAGTRPRGQLGVANIQKEQNRRGKLLFHKKHFFSKMKIICQIKIAFAVTWIGVIVLNVDFGLYIAMATSLLMTIFATQRLQRNFYFFSIFCR